MGITRRQVVSAAGLAGLGGLTAARDPAGAQGDDMVAIPAGLCRLGTSRAEAERLARKYGCHVSWLSGEWPQRSVDLPAFAIGRFPVTNRQFAAFCRATGFAPRGHWMGPEPPAHLLDHPVLMVNQEDCRAYARWAGKRLPTEDEWERAARGTEGRLFPWGDRFDPTACQWNMDDPAKPVRYPPTAPVGDHPKGASVYGVMDLCGNAAEWVEGSPGPGSGIVKGGCWMTATPMNLRPAARNMSGSAVNQTLFIGFRCAKDAR